MARKRIKEEYMVPCPACGVGIDAPCVSRYGTSTSVFHGRRVELTALVREAMGVGSLLYESPPCAAPVVRCWLRSCTKDPSRCEFCGVCEDPECELRHTG